MELWQIVVIAVAVAVVVLVLICALTLKKRLGKTNGNADKRKDDRTLISENEHAVTSLLELVKGNDALLDEICKIRERIRFLIPSEDGKIRDYDLKIKDHIEDLRILFEKTEPNEPNKKVDALILQLKTEIGERDAKI